MHSTRTDLAMEAREPGQWQGLRGVTCEVNRDDTDITITRVVVTDEEGVKAIHKPVGKYITLEAPGLRLRDVALNERVSHCLARELAALLGEQPQSAMVVGLGNWNITPDSLGPKVVSRIMVTRHLMQMMPENLDERLRTVSAFSPGVLGITGVETAEIVMGVVQRVKPSLVITVDALASSKSSRLSSTVQITDSGIAPGSGVGNHRNEISAQTMGVPVISVGVPTVVYGATIARDMIRQVMGDAQAQVYERSAERILDPQTQELIVTPREIDTVISDVARVVSMGLNLFIHRGVTIDEVDRFLN